MSQVATTEWEQMITLPELVPPPGARPVGVFEDGSPTGKIIYRQKVLDPIATAALRRPKMLGGEPVYRRSAAGVPVQQVFELPRPVFREREGILVGFRSKKVKFVERFRETPEEAAERIRRAQVKGFAEDLANEAVSRGFKSAADFVATLLGRQGEPAEELQEMIEEADEHISKGGVEVEMQLQQAQAQAAAAETPKKGGKKS